ncbi:AAA family ATPase [Ensifer sp. Root127]|uniref:AAA family ATPase n=1 Tax=Ensifer sp. Root127 TaxID=1736440 RepID=UPI00070AC326|nr:AAA family ATPase [Ensifer sp. Root127]
MHSAVRHAMRPASDFNAGGRGIIVLVAPPETSVYQYVQPVTNLIHEEDDPRHGTTPDVGFWCITPRDDVKKLNFNLESECLDKKRAIVLAWSRDALPQIVILAADHIFDIEPIEERDLRVACRAVLKMRLTRQQARELLEFPLNNVFSALRVGRSFDETLRRLQAVPIVIEDVKEPQPPKVETVTSLENMHGYGPAKEWGLQLATDLRDWRDGKIVWSDVDTGLLLSGPPGTGKTIFARALAETCGTHLIAASLGQWQARGHLGDLLAAMRRDFATARDKAPCILFIDELDSVGDRDRFSHTNTNYSTQVVNALLECIDGVSVREGVIVIGATNNPTRIDPAVRRAGRLDKHVSIPLPSPEDRVAILCQHLGEEIQAEAMQELGALTEGMTGADLAQLARDARRSARRAKRRVQLSDVHAHLPELLPIAGLFRRSIAIHEAGHAIVGSRLSYGKLVGIEIAAAINPRIQVQNAGRAGFMLEPIRFRDRQTYCDQICVFLAGIAAEELELGSYGDGAGVGQDNDLQRATDAAMFMETQVGMGKGLAYLKTWHATDSDTVRLSDPRLPERIEALLHVEFDRAKLILDEDRPLLVALSQELEATGFVSPERFVDLQTRCTSRRKTAS